MGDAPGDGGAAAALRALHEKHAALLAAHRGRAQAISDERSAQARRQVELLPAGGWQVPGSAVAAAAAASASAAAGTDVALLAQRLAREEDAARAALEALRSGATLARAREVGERVLLQQQGEAGGGDDDGGGGDDGGDGGDGGGGDDGAGGQQPTGPQHLAPLLQPAAAPRPVFAERRRQAIIVQRPEEGDGAVDSGAPASPPRQSVYAAGPRPLPAGRPSQFRGPPQEQPAAAAAAWGQRGRRPDSPPAEGPGGEGLAAGTELEALRHQIAALQSALEKQQQQQAQQPAMPAFQQPLPYAAPPMVFAPQMAGGAFLPPPWAMAPPPYWQQHQQAWALPQQQHAHPAAFAPPIAAPAAAPAPAAAAAAPDDGDDPEVAAARRRHARAMAMLRMDVERARASEELERLRASVANLRRRDGGRGAAAAAAAAAAGSAARQARESLGFASPSPSPRPPRPEDAGAAAPQLGAQGQQRRQSDSEQQHDQRLAPDGGEGAAGGPSGERADKQPLEGASQADGDGDGDMWGRHADPEARRAAALAAVDTERLALPGSAGDGAGDGGGNAVAATVATPPPGEGAAGPGDGLGANADSDVLRVGRAMAGVWWGLDGWRCD